MPLSNDFIEQFATPGDDYRPHIMWFWNAPLEEDEVRRQVRDFRDAGIFDFYIHPMYGFPVDYLSEEMFEAIGWAVDEARKHGMRFWIYDEYNWPSGAAGGYLIRDNPDRRMLVVTSDEQASEHGPQDDHAAWQCVDESGKATVFHETPQNGVCPFAQWSPFCWGQEGYGDVSDPETVRAFIELTHEAYRSRFPGELGKTIAGLFTDEVSYCLAGFYGESERPLPWTHGMRETFLERHGYDVAAHLPSLLANVGDYRRIRCDYWHYLTGRLESAYYRQCAEWCREHGLTLTGHLSGEELFRHNILFFGDFYRCLRWLDIPGIDAIFPRLNHEADHFMVAAKSGGSAIRQLGRDRLLCETYTGSGWELTPEQMKIIFDKLALGGVNLLQYMGAYYSIAGMRKVLPGGYPPSHGHQNPFWPFYRTFGDYVARICQTLALSRSTGKVAVLHPITTAFCEWAGSAEDLARGVPGPPAFEAMQQAFLAVTNLLLELGVDYDYLFEDVLASANVDRGTVLTAEVEYELLILPNVTCLTRKIAEKLAGFLEAGGRTVFVNSVPGWTEGDPALLKRVTDHLSALPDNEGREAAAALQEGTGTHLCGRDRVTWIVSNDLPPDARDPLRNALDAVIPREFRALPEMPSSVRASRRVFDGEPLLFLYNQGPERVSVPLPADVNTVLDPETGDAGSIDANVDLAPFQTLIAARTDGQVCASRGPEQSWTQELVLGEAEFSLLTANLLTAAWQVRTSDAEEWQYLDGLHFPATCAVQPGDEYELKWTFRIEEGAEPVEIVTEDLTEAFHLELNERPLTGFERARIWDWRNLRADIRALVVPGENVVTFRSRTPGWDGPHTPPLTAIRGDFCVDDGCLVKTRGRLGPGSWAEAGFPNYTGTARYRWRCELPPLGGRVWAHAEEVAAVAALIVNGHRLAPRLWRPYTFDITDLVLPGPNEIELEVTSSAANLLGLNQPELFLEGKAATALRERQAAGLLTPVSIRW
jgi:hypothetical protein